MGSGSTSGQGTGLLGETWGIPAPITIYRWGFNTAFVNSPPDMIDGEEEWEVEWILAHRRRGREYQYLVHFKDYSNAKDKWLPAKNLEHLSELLDKYKQGHNL
jgi:Chromo (CHRromatin Organisation MOdifier) domain